MSEAEVVETTGREIVPANGHAEPLALIQGSPTEVVARATAMADKLRDVINQQKLYANIQGKKHVTVEGWTTLGALVGVFPVVAWSRPVGDGDGWEARVEVRTASGNIIGAAEAQCTRSERMWSSRDDYALRSMAQTRATSKAMRLPLSWIMALAGFEVTPADEMPVHPVEEPAPAPPPPKRAPGATGVGRGLHGPPAASVAQPGLPDKPDVITEIWTALKAAIPGDGTEARDQRVDFIQQKFPQIVRGEGDRRQVNLAELDKDELAAFLADLRAIA